MSENPYDLSTLLSYEADELHQLYRAWQQALAGRDFITADNLRAELLEWQTDLGWLTMGQWLSVAEPAAHRQRRAEERRSRYNIENFHR